MDAGGPQDPAQKFKEKDTGATEEKQKRPTHAGNTFFMQEDQKISHFFNLVLGSATFHQGFRTNTLNPQPQTLNPKPSTQDPKSSTPNPKP